MITQARKQNDVIADWEMTGPVRRFYGLAGGLLLRMRDIYTFRMWTVNRVTHEERELKRDRIFDEIIPTDAGQTYAREHKTFNYAADQYIAWRKPAKRELGFIHKMRAYIGDKPVHEITQSDAVALANTLYPTGKGSSKKAA